MTDHAAGAGAPATDDRLRRDALVVAALTHVPFDGWTITALKAAARDLDMDAGEALSLFPEGAPAMVEAFSDWADRAMLEAMLALPLDAMRVRDRVTAGVEARLRALAPHREAARSAMGFLALPLHAPLAARLVYRTVDAIWYAAGDTATDFNFYTKRGLLAGVYGATVLYWMTDRSPDHGDTWSFLSRRIDDAMRLPRLGAGLGTRLGAILRHLPDPRRFLHARRGPVERPPF